MAWSLWTILTLNDVIAVTNDCDVDLAFALLLRLCPWKSADFPLGGWEHLIMKFGGAGRHLVG